MNKIIIILQAIVYGSIFSACAPFHPNTIYNCYFYTHDHRIRIDDDDGRIASISVFNRGSDSCGDWEENTLFNLRDEAEGSRSFSFDRIDSQRYTHLYQKVYNPDSILDDHLIISDSGRRGFTFTDTVSYRVSIGICSSEKSPGYLHWITFREAELDLRPDWSKEDSIHTEYWQEYK